MEAYMCQWSEASLIWHDDVIKWKHFPRYWPFVRGIHRSPVNSPHKGQWRGALMFSLICAWINRWVNNREAGDLRHHRAHYDVALMTKTKWPTIFCRQHVWGIILSPVDFPHKGQWRGALIFSLIFARTNSWAKNRDAGDLRRYRAHSDLTVILSPMCQSMSSYTISRHNVHDKSYNSFPSTFYAFYWFRVTFDDHMTSYKMADLI